jgi:small-conductance mechanosensitive channel
MVMDRLALRNVCRQCARIALVLSLGLAAAAGGISQAGKAPKSPAHAQKAAPAGEKPVSGEPPNAAGSAQAANGAAPGQPTAPKPVTALHLEALPKPLPASLTQGIDVAQRSKDIVEHLGEVIRFYRMTATPIQKSGDASDILYAEQAQSIARQVAQLAFQSARDEAALLARIEGAAGTAAQQPVEGTAQRMRNAQARVAQQIRDLQTRSAAVEKQLATARPAARGPLLEQKQDIAGEAELLAAEAEALSKVAGVSLAQSNSSLQGQIDKLQHAVPEVVDNKVKPVTNSLENIGSLRDAGVTTQAQVLFQLMATMRAIDDRQEEIKKLHDQAQGLRAPLVNILRATVQEGRRLEDEDAAEAAQNAVAGAKKAASGPSEDRLAIRKTYDQLTDAFKTISGVSVPISQEILLLEQAQGNLLSWRAAVDLERRGILHSLLIRLALIGAALVFVLVLGEIWRRAATRYVQDLRRRRQLLLVRRIVVGFLSGLVIILGFVTQFSSLATFAGFITAGIAVGLQTILLSVAAYFFIVGRYGVKVGDRITVANVTGEVVEVGLARFYMLELAGTGNELHPTGRVAVFANSVLFQTGTPLYKQIPGTNYVWHEMTVKLKPGAKYDAAMTKIRGAVEEVYGEYKPQIEREHAVTEAWMDTAVPAPKVESRLQFNDGLQLVVLYPVRVGHASDADQKIVEKVANAIAADAEVSQAIDGAPAVKTVMKI